MISIIIPTYNEKKNIVPLIKKISRALAKEKLSYEVIVVDDNSPDNTAATVIKKFAKNRNVRTFVRKKESGLATAILYGIKKAKGKIIVGMDADFNHPPELIPILVYRLKFADLIVASRFIKGGGMENRGRFFFTLTFNFFLKNLLGFPTMDNMSGFYAISASKLKKLPLDNIYRGYGEYHLRLVFNAKRSGLKITEVPVFYKKRAYGKSKSNLIKLFFVYSWVTFKLKFVGPLKPFK